ncbi:MAG: SOS response-associated peptidase [Gammaproteobacteria bacterium]|nr:SOS response-associated peptidase [Gammaproteobacteria bacterium]
MCGRLALFSDPADVARHVGLAGVPDLAPRWNVAPGTGLCIVRHDAATGERRAGEVAWGLLPAWADPARPGPRPINARAESAAHKPMFRDAWRRRRCLVPADGWYEWTPGDGGRDPWYFALPTGALLGLAGLWSTWHGADGTVRESAAILTREAHPELRPIHERMPAVVDPADYAAWLDPDRPADPALLDAGTGRRVRPQRVSRRVNSPAHDGPGLLAPPAEAG